MKNKEHYKELLESNGYINLPAVIEFLRNNCIADFEVISEIYGKGMRMDDFRNLQEAIDEVEAGNEL